MASNWTSAGLRITTISVAAFVFPTVTKTYLLYPGQVISDWHRNTHTHTHTHTVSTLKVHDLAISQQSLLRAHFRVISRSLNTVHPVMHWIPLAIGLTERSPTMKITKLLLPAIHQIDVGVLGDNAPVTV